jgi:tripartite-type tricarboxylate transporter receptor subunit TctC
VNKRLSALTLEPMPMTPAKFAQRLKDDYGKYETLMKLAAQASKRQAGLI